MQRLSLLHSVDNVGVVGNVRHCKTHSMSLKKEKTSYWITLGNTTLAFDKQLRDSRLETVYGLLLLIPNLIPEISDGMKETFPRQEEYLSMSHDIDYI